jgi:hypothetical protein
VRRHDMRSCGAYTRLITLVLTFCIKRIDFWKRRRGRRDEGCVTQGELRPPSRSSLERALIAEADARVWYTQQQREAEQELFGLCEYIWMKTPSSVAIAGIGPETNAVL